MKKTIFTLIVGLLFIGSAEAKVLTVNSGNMDFLMDAPVEKIKGKTGALSGNLTIDGEDLKTVKGELVIDISKIVTYTFEDAGKNKSQNEHMLNWFEIGPDVKEEMRVKYKSAVLKVSGAKSVEDKSDTEKLVTLDADLVLHGMTVKYPIELLVNKSGDGYKVKTNKPFKVGLVEHDVRPRDLAGKLLQKTLEALGHKVAKYAQVSVELELK